MSLPAITYYDGPNGLTTINTTDGDYIQIDPFRSLNSPNLALQFPQSTYIKLHARTSEFSPTTLGNTKHTYESIYYADIIGLANYFADWNCTYKITEGSQLLIEVDVPWDTIANTDFTVSDFVTEQWEIVPTQDIKPLPVNGILANPFSPPSFQGNYIVLPDVMKIAVQNAYDNKFALTIPPNTPQSNSLAPFLPYAQQILNYQRGGVDGVPSYTQALKRTAVVDVRNTNRAFQKTVDFERAAINAEGTVNFMISTFDLTNGYEVTEQVAENLNPSYTKQVTVTGLEANQYYAYAGWLVNPPIIKFITPNKVQYEQHFLWNEFLAGLYYIKSTPASFPLVASAASNPNGFIPSP